MKTILLAFASAAALLVAATGADAAERTLKLSLYVPLDSLQGMAAQNFEKLVETNSKGQLKVDLFPSNQLGGPYDVIDAQSAGSIEMSLLGYDIYTKYSPTLNLAGLSFIFADREHAFTFFNSPLHERAKQEILESTSVRVLGNSEWNQGPYKILLTKDPVLKTDDIKGVAMRVPNNEVDLLIWGAEGVGANTIPVPWPEAQLALSQGLVRAIELPADFVRAFSFFESASYLMLSRHRHQLVYMTIADSVWKQLSPEEQKILTDATVEAGLGYTDSVLKGWESDIEFLKSKGVVVVDFDVSQWHDAAIRLARGLEAKDTWPKGLVDELIALNK
jgi:TRAP-type C4-dicarboxylate transport system substrate-binding protein